MFELHFPWVVNVISNCNKYNLELHLHVVWWLCFCVFVLHTALKINPLLLKHVLTCSFLDAKTSRLTDVLQQFRDGVYPQYNPEKVSDSLIENYFHFRVL